MNKPVLNIVFICFTAFFLKSQENLVPNGSFEEYNWCPDIVNGYYIDACKYWTMPTLGSSDYFNACSTDTVSDTFTQFSVPRNYIGFQHAHSGNAYAGLAFAQTNINSPAYSEYIQVQLKKQLEFGKFYHLQFYLNNSDTICVNSIGALFSSNELNIFNDNIISIEHLFQSDFSNFFCDTLKWYELNFTFQATGDENYLIIGVFTPMPIIETTHYNGEPFTNHEVTPYYFIDDVSLVEVDYMSLIKDKIPNVFTPNSDGINDFFSFDNQIVHAKKLTILNRWGNVVYESESHFSWDGKYQEKDSPEGIYFYNIEVTKQIRLNGFIQLIR